jgi:hypothetical protein
LWELRFLGVLVAALTAHFSLFGLMVRISDSHDPAGFYATWGAMTGGIGSLFFALGFAFSFNPPSKIRTICVMVILGTVAATTASVLLGVDTILTNQQNHYCPVKETFQGYNALISRSLLAQ